MLKQNLTRKKVTTMKRKVSKAQIRKERNPKKLKRVLKAKGYHFGRVPKGKVPHHVKAIAAGGKTTKKNIRVISKAKHRRIHKNRKKRGKI